MIAQKKYKEIARYGHKSTIGSLILGDDIVIQEKIDGANASFMRDGDVVRAFSRNTELDENNTLNGFYQFTRAIKAEDLLNGVIYFGEWTTPHKIKYPEHTHEFFLFDVFTYKGKLVIEEGFYFPYHIVRAEASRLGLQLVPTFFEGKFTGNEQLAQYVGKTLIGGQLRGKEMGEGIVVKNAGRFDKYNKQQYVKIVVDELKEVKQQKSPKEVPAERAFVDTTVTKARVEKILYKLVDEGVLEKDDSIEEMGKILKQVNQRVYEDIMKEEADMLFVGYNEKHVTKSIAKVTPLIIKEIIAEKGAIV